MNIEASNNRRWASLTKDNPLAKKKYERSKAENYNRRKIIRVIHNMKIPNPNQGWENTTNHLKIQRFVSYAKNQGTLRAGTRRTSIRSSTAFRSRRTCVEAYANLTLT